MNYNEYKAPDGKVLFNLDNFTYGNTILSIHNLNLVVLDKEEAERLSNEYEAEKRRIEEEQRKLEEESKHKKENNIEEDNSEDYGIQTMSLDEEGFYVEDATEEEINNSKVNELSDIEKHKQNAIASLLARGILIDKSDVIINTKETKYI